jgi:hypothetical protein
MPLTASQTELLMRLRSEVEASPSRRVIYRSEWLGYLPYGLYHWIEVDRRDISLALPSGWCLADLMALAEVGVMVKVDEWQDPMDELDRKVTFEVPRAAPTLG